MNLTKTALILCSIMMGFAAGPASSWAAGTVTVNMPGNSTPVQLNNVARLVDAVTAPEVHSDWWRGAVISYQGASIKMQQEHQQLLADLDALARDEGGDSGAAIQALRAQLALVKVTGRQLVRLDPDWLRLHSQQNVPLEGQYQLWLPAQPNTVTILGLVSKPETVAFTPGKSVADYLDDQSLLSGAERSYAWVIYPDGSTEKVPVAYWNKRHIEPSPGSLIFVGFGSHLFSSSWDELNKRILTSLTHRIPD
ncbi:capsule biosynthesis GfcC family protein [Mangrovibacter phragmitis]|uniref:capsule biosynthesis GfcC family protein n=1 Tax=Mangrovibacter phragmitis TaxID=1691903 RepID=UPI0035137B70